MKELNPQHIPEIIALISGAYNEKRPLTKDEDVKVNTFFSAFLGGHLTTCMNASRTHWAVARPTKDLAFQTKSVLVPGIEGSSVEFVVATTATLTSSDLDFADYKKATADLMIDTFGDVTNPDTVVVLNRLIFRDNGPIADRHSHSAIFLCVRFSANMFKPDAANEPTQVH